MGKSDWKRSWKPWLRGTAFGFPFGALPAGGAEIPTFLSYSTEKKLTKHPEEFGKGAIELVDEPLEDADWVRLRDAVAIVLRGQHRGTVPLGQGQSDRTAAARAALSARFRTTWLSLALSPATRTAAEPWPSCSDAGRGARYGRRTGCGGWKA
jgi:Tripartite tricarboxylate transporter TctA family